MHWSDIRTFYEGGQLLCFAEVLDDLIEEGWEDVQVRAAEKRTATSAGLDD